MVNLPSWTSWCRLKLPPVGVLWQLTKYCVVAVFGVGLHLGLIAFSIEVLRLHYTVAFIGALPITFVSKFVLDKFWTFRR